MLRAGGIATFLQAYPNGTSLGNIEAYLKEVGLSVRYNFLQFYRPRKSLAKNIPTGTFRPHKT